MLYLVAFIAVLGFATSAIFGVLLLKRNKSDPQADAARNQFLLLQQQMQNNLQNDLKNLREELSQGMIDSVRQNREQVGMLTQQLNERMKETSSTLQSTQTSVGERLDNAARVVGELQRKLGGLEESNKRIFELGQGLSELKDILKNPKLRGNMGEFFLEDLLRPLPHSARVSLWGKS